MRDFGSNRSITATTLLLCTTVLIAFGPPPEATTQIISAGAHLGISAGKGAPIEAEASPNGSYWNVGLAGEIRPVKGLGIYVEVNYSSIDRRVTLFSPDKSRSAGETVSILQLPFSFRLDLKKNGLIPYLYAGSTVGTLLKGVDAQIALILEGGFGVEGITSYRPQADIGIGSRGRVTGNLDVKFDLGSTFLLEGRNPLNADEWSFNRIQCTLALVYRIL